MRILVSKIILFTFFALFLSFKITDRYELINNFMEFKVISAYNNFTSFQIAYAWVIINATAPWSIFNNIDCTTLYNGVPKTQWLHS